jgi:hypothetical protein
VRPRVLRKPHLFERDRQIEVGVGVERIESQRLAVAGLRFVEPSEIVINVAEIEVGFKEVGLEIDRLFVERLGLGQFVSTVVDVGEVNDRGDQTRIELERLPVRCGRFVLFGLVAVVED